jgi:hypothetical protein
MGSDRLDLIAVRQPADIAASEIWPALAAPVLFSRPKFLRDAAILHHVPFLFWLIDACRPQRIVELGIDRGVSYFAACQAVETLGLSATCHGFRDWQDGRPPAWIEQYATEQYQEFSKLGSASPDDAADRFEERSIDLLIVDLPCDDALAATLVERWWSRMSSRGVVLLHGTEVLKAQPFFARIARDGDCFRFEHGAGLTVLALGDDVPAKLQLFLSQGATPVGAAELIRIFRRMGAGLAAEGRTVTARKKIDELEKQRQEFEALAICHRTLEEQYRELGQSAARLKARLFDLERDNAAARTELEEAKAAQATLRQDRAASEAELLQRDLAYAAARTELEEAKAAQAELRQDRETLQSDIEHLTGKCIERHALEADLRQVQTELAEAKKLCQELHNSTSWKITGPLRSVVRSIRR